MAIMTHSFSFSVSILQRPLYLPQLPTPLSPNPNLKHPLHLFQTQPGCLRETTRAKDEPERTEE